MPRTREELAREIDVFRAALAAFQHEDLKPTIQMFFSIERELEYHDPEIIDHVIIPFGRLIAAADELLDYLSDEPERSHQALEQKMRGYGDADDAICDEEDPPKVVENLYGAYLDLNSRRETDIPNISQLMNRVLQFLQESSLPSSRADIAELPWVEDIDHILKDEIFSAFYRDGEGEDIGEEPIYLSDEEFATTGLRTQSEKETLDRIRKTAERGERFIFPTGVKTADELLGFFEEYDELVERNRSFIRMQNYAETLLAAANVLTKDRVDHDVEDIANDLVTLVFEKANRDRGLGGQEAAK